MNPAPAFATTFVDQLWLSGVRHACLAPGSRSAPLAMALARQGRIRLWVHIDERSCSFFALGLAKATETTVAILCTSGTAAAEFHPAVIEADLSRTPLLVLTADRPPELREVGANQAVDQARIYGSAVRWFFDPGPPADGPEAAAGWRRLAARAVAETRAAEPGPVHLNLPLREPLVGEPGETVAPTGEPALRVLRAPSPPTSEQISLAWAALNAARRPVLVAGEMREGGALAAAAFRLGIPVLAEPTSQLRRPGAIASSDALLRDRRFAATHAPDLVIRLGAQPTSKPLFQWLAASGARTLLVDEAGWRDPDLAATDLLRCDAGALLGELAETTAERSSWLEEWRRADAAAQAGLEAGLAAAPLFEGSAVRELARQLPAGTDVFAGSSMPIRDVDSFWPAVDGGGRLIANRGASGIDGLVSTGLGAGAGSGRRNVVLLGDLSLYHDMNGLWAIRRHALKSLVVVLDNDGGGIFSFLPQARHEDVFEEVFGTPLGLRLEEVARLYGLPFSSVSDKEGLPAALSAALAEPGPGLLAVRFGRPDSVAAHRLCWEAVAGSLLESGVTR